MDTYSPSEKLENFRQVGIQAKRQGRYDDAIALYQRALEVDSTYIHTYQAMAKVLFLKGDRQKAIEYYLEYLLRNIGGSALDVHLLGTEDYRSELIEQYFSTTNHIGHTYVDLDRVQSNLLIEYILKQTDFVKKDVVARYLTHFQESYRVVVNGSTDINSEAVISNVKELVIDPDIDVSTVKELAQIYYNKIGQAVSGKFLNWKRIEEMATKSRFINVSSTPAKVINQKSQELNVEQLFELGMTAYASKHLEEHINALKYFHMAAVQEHAMSQYMLGLMYESGIGTEMDVEKSLSWLYKAAKQNLEAAQLAFIRIKYFNKDQQKLLASPDAAMELTEMHFGADCESDLEQSRDFQSNLPAAKKAQINSLSGQKKRVIKSKKQSDNTEEIALWEYAISAVKDNYANFSGRARRREYWGFTLFAYISIIILNILAKSISIFGIPYLIFCLGIFIPSLSIAVRRLHDVGKSGWFLLLLLIPFVGPIWLLVLNCTDGVLGDNEYGPNPKGSQQA